MRIYNSGNGGSALLYVDTDGELITPGKLKVDSDLVVGGSWYNYAGDYEPEGTPRCDCDGNGNAWDCNHDGFAAGTQTDAFCFDWTNECSIVYQRVAWGDLQVGGGITLGGVEKTEWPAGGGTDTNASTICFGTNTYLDGDGNCDTVVDTDTDTWITTQTCGAGEYLSSVGKASKTCSTPAVGWSDCATIESNCNYVNESSDTMTGTLNISAGGGDALVIEDGGDLRIYNSGNTGSALLYVDDDGELITPGKLKVGGDLEVTGGISSEFYDLGVDCALQCYDSTRTALVYHKDHGCLGQGKSCIGQGSCIEGLGCTTACHGMSVTDFDGNSYGTVEIGTQCWMTENMRTTHNPAGIAITRYCYNDISANCDTDGGLYTWGTAMSDGGPQGICPDGWHVPTDAEYTILTNYLGSNPGDKMKTIDKCSPGGTDCGTDCGTSGFNGLLAGLKSSDECTYYHFGTYTFLWSSTQNEGNAWDRRLSSGYSHVGRECSSKEYGCSVRCIRDY